MAVPMHPLTPETEEEKEMFKLGEGVTFFSFTHFVEYFKLESCFLARKNIRHLETQASLLKIPPSLTESSILHELFLRTIDEQYVF